MELKSWVAKDAADRGQLLKDADLTDAAIYARLAQDQHFRAAATRLLQNYGYLLAKPNPDSEVGRKQAALEQERIRQVVAAQHEQLTKCDGSSAVGNPNCQSIQKPPQKAALQTGTSNPGELPKDRDFDQLLTNPVPQPTSGNGSLLRVSTNPLESGSSSGIAGSESDLTLLPISYDRMALPDPDAPPQPSPVTAAPATRRNEAQQSWKRLARDERASDQQHWSPYSDIPSIYDMFVHAPTSSGLPRGVSAKKYFKIRPGFRERSPSISQLRRIMS